MLAGGQVYMHACMPCSDRQGNEGGGASGNLVCTYASVGQACAPMPMHACLCIHKVELFVSEAGMGGGKAHMPCDMMVNHLEDGVHIVGLLATNALLQPVARLKVHLQMCNKQSQFCDKPKSKCEARPSH